MIARHFRQAVDCKRLSRTVDAVTGKEIPTTGTVLSSVRCLIEPLPPRQIESLMGRSINAQYRITWGSDDMRENDTIVFGGKEYIMREVVSDTLRVASPAYRTGVLVERSNK